MVVSDDSAHVVNSWSHEQQCVPQVRYVVLVAIIHVAC